jgi:hypothetical protein
MKSADSPQWPTPATDTHFYSIPNISVPPKSPQKRKNTRSNNKEDNHRNHPQYDPEMPLQ